MRLFLFAIAITVALAVLGCSDGKLNLLLVFWGDYEEPSSSSIERIPPSSSSVVVIPSSSSLYVPPPSSSEEEEPSSSSEEIQSSSSSFSSSSSELPSSSSRGPRSSSSKTDSNGNTYVDYPTLEPGAPGIKKGVTTRYWDGCRPSCAYIGNIGKLSNPLNISRACDKNGINEIPLLYLHPRSDANGTYYNAVPCHKEPDPYWEQSQTYKDWASEHSDFPKGSHAYTCFDMAPFAVNDTLAYAFAATLETTLPCGKCAQLQFNNEWTYDSKPRVTHRALKGKTLIVMANNTGTVGENHFDIMIPGGGLGAFDCFSAQIGVTEADLGQRMGGLLSDCIFPNAEDAKKYGPTSDRYTLETWQTCMTDKCYKAFGNKSKYLLDGCLWHAEWFMAADNPEVEWTEVPCPKYLLDKYNSTTTNKLPDCYVNGTCQIDGVQKYGP